MEQNAVERWRVGVELQVPSGNWLMLGICSLSVLESSMKHCLCLFLCMAVKKGLNEMIDEGALQWFGHMERNMFAKRVYVGECAGIRPVGRPRKRWIDTVKECLKK